MNITGKYRPVLIAGLLSVIFFTLVLSACRHELGSMGSGQIVFYPVTDIIDVPLVTTKGKKLILNGTVIPEHANHKTIEWSVLDHGNTYAQIIEGNIFDPYEKGAATITATIANGMGERQDYIKNFVITVHDFTAVEDIIDVPTSVIVREPHFLSSKIIPEYATKTDIDWEVKSGPAFISGYYLTVDRVEPVVITATIIDGIDEGIDFTKDFSISAIQPVTGITDAPSMGFVDVPLSLTATVEPVSASFKEIDWKVTKGRGSINESNELFANAFGEVEVTATVKNGLGEGKDYSKAFIINIWREVERISGVPKMTNMKVPLNLTGKIEPENTFSRGIEWLVKQGSATISDGNILTAETQGTVVVTARVLNGTALGYYTEDFSITVMQSVLDITGVPTSTTVGTQLTLTSTVAPVEANFKSIIWTVTGGQTQTGAFLTGNILRAFSPGTATVTATIIDGKSEGDNFVKNFNILIIQPVTNITNIPTQAVVGTPLTLTPIIVPENASDKNINWSVIGGATVDGNKLEISMPGKVTITAEIANGKGTGQVFSQNFELDVMQPVDNITSVPTVGMVGVPLTLTGVVIPSYATNQTIIWSVSNAGTTGAAITGNTLNTTRPGTVTVTATINNGKGYGLPAAYNFPITVSVAAATEISGIPLTTTVGPLALNGIVTPSNATNKTIVWTVRNAGTTSAEIVGNSLVTWSGGTVVIRGTIDNINGTSYSQDFTITVIQPVTSIVGIPDLMQSGFTTLSGVVSPANATYKDISWGIQNAGTTGATINGNILGTTSGGTLRITGTISNGTAEGQPYSQNFTITVIKPVADIGNKPSVAQVNVPLNLGTASVIPSDASQRTIIWTVKDQGSTGATISGNNLNAAAKGNAMVNARVSDGLYPGSDYSLDIPVTVNVVEVAEIRSVPLSTKAMQDLTLSGSVMPANATNRSIVWTVKSEENTEASIVGDVLKTTAIPTDKNQGNVVVTATILEGLINGNYTQDFTITINKQFVPVTGIEVSEDSLLAKVKVPLSLTAAVAPIDATRQTIIWTVFDAETTGASISNGNILNTTSWGTATIRATIVDGIDEGTPFIHNFTVLVEVIPVTDISGIPSATTTAVPLTLSGIVAPSDATNTAISWTVQNSGGTGALISGNTLTATAGGTVTITATIANGSYAGVAYTQNFNIVVIRPVADIIGMPTAGAVGDLTLAPTVSPNEASKKDIVWSINDAGTTGATVSGNILTTTSTGIVSVTATIEDGLAIGNHYTKSFSINIIRPVTNITGVPKMAYEGTDLSLTGTVVPDNASSQTIVWTVENPGTTGAAITGSTFKATIAGTATIRATISNGRIQSGQLASYTQDFDIDVLAATSVVLSVSDFEITDEGKETGVFTVVTPVVLKKSEGTVRTIQLGAGLTPVSWRVGNIPMGTGTSVTLDAAVFNIGVYTLNITFTKDGKPWLGSLSFEVIQ